MAQAARKMFMGARLRRLREERGLTQAALASALAISPSYLNQLENNQRPLTVAVLLKLNASFGLDVQIFSDDDEARLVAQLREACLDAPGGEAVARSELRELALNMPAAARVVVGLHQRYRAALDQAQAASSRLGDTRHDAPGPPTAYEEVRDFFYERRNHITALDAAAEALAFQLQIRPSTVVGALAARLAERHGVSLEIDPDRTTPARRFVASDRRLVLSSRLTDGQRAFQTATQLALLEYDDLIARELADTSLTLEAQELCRVGLANYFAGAVVLPYGLFLQAAEASGYDIEALSARFGVGLETVCHRLSTLQRRGAAGVPFILVRTDRAGNISKRQSATDFHFSRFGGVCPLWGVYETFAEPGRVRVQLAEMPDGRRYIWIATAVRHPPTAFGAPETLFSIGLGCDLSQAPRLAYARGLAIDQSEAFAPIGLGCKVCDRVGCAQRAFPPLGRKLRVETDTSHRAPYLFDQ